MKSYQQQIDEDDEEMGIAEFGEVYTHKRNRTYRRICFGLLLVLLVAGITAAIYMSVSESGSRIDPDHQRPSEPDALVAYLLDNAPLIDLHNDWPWALRALAEFRRAAATEENKYVDPLDSLDNLPELDTDITRLREGHVGAQIWSVWVPCNGVSLGPMRTVEQMDLVQRVIARRPDVFARASIADDVQRIHANGKIASFMGMEGGHSVNSSLATVRAYYDLGARYMTLTHSCSTPWAQSSAAEREEDMYNGRYATVRGLTDFGRKVVGEMNRVGMMVDISHVSEQTMHDVLDHSMAPVIFSHSNVRSICNVTRNVPDTVLDRLKENGGVVHIVFLLSFLSEQARDDEEAWRHSCGDQCDWAHYHQWTQEYRATSPISVKEVADHIDYIKNRVGVDHVGIGSDFDGSSGFLPKDLSDVSMYPNLFRELLSRGYSDEEIMKVAGRNTLRVMREVEGIAMALSTVPAADDKYTGTYETDDDDDSKWTEEDSTVTSKHGAVAADSKECSEMGADILKAGGHAADAAVTVALCLGLMHPFASGVGGGHFSVVYDRKAQQARVIDARETAPGAATWDMFVNVTEEEETKRQQHSKGHPPSQKGGLSVGTPGEVAGLAAMHALYGKLPWKDCVLPVAELAESGVRIDYVHSMYLQFYHDVIMQFDALANIYAPNGQILKENDVVKRPKFADTLRRIAYGGPTAFYTGDIAEALAADVQAAGGILTANDLRAYAPLVKAAVRTTYRNYSVLTAPPPSSGAVVSMMLQALELYEDEPLEHDDFEARARDYHRIVEAMKFGFAARTELGDPRSYNLSAIYPKMISREWAQRVHDRIDEAQTHEPAYYEPSATVQVDHGTSHFSVIDGAGNAVALTSTVNLLYGSMVLSESTGVILNDQIDDFSVHPEEPNAFGLQPDPANYIRAHKRPLSSMSPMVMLHPTHTKHRDEVYAVIGASGGPQIPTAVLQTFLFMHEADMTPKEAILQPRVHHQLMPNYVIVDKTFDEAVADALRAKGHDVRLPPSPLADGQLSAVVQAARRVWSEEKNVWELTAASDPRKHGKSVVWKRSKIA